MSGRSKAAWGAGLGAALGVGAALGRTLIRRDQRRPDSEAAEHLLELPEDDLGSVQGFDGTPLVVRAQGPADAPALVFVHGFSLDMTAWHYQWKAFAERFRCIVYDQRGHGRSGLSPQRDYSIQAMGRDLRSVLDAAVPEGPVVLVGHSMGGMAMLAMAERHPEEFGGRVAGAVFADTAAAEIVRGAVGAIVSRLHALAAVPRRADRVRRYFQEGRSDLAFLVARLSNFGPKAPPSLVRHVAGLSGQAPIEVWTDGLAGIMALDLRHALEHVVVPALVVVGDLDRITPPASARALVEKLPDARLLVLRGAGHMAIMERHRQFNRALEQHVERSIGAWRPIPERTAG